MAKEEVKFEEHSYTYDELLNLKFRLILNPDYYVKQNGIWVNKQDDKDYLKGLLSEAEE